MDNEIVISTPPHVKSKRTTKGIMLDVVISLVPCAVMGCVFFGWQALMIILMSVLACVATEFVYFFIANKGFAKKCRDAKDVCLRWLKQFDFTSVVTGLILALILPVTDKWYTVLYEVLIGGFFSITVAKMFFGGTGKNLVNPAATGRVMMFLSFSIITYTAASIPAIGDGVLTTGATNLSYLLGSNPESALGVLDLFLGTGVMGCIGETCKVAILVGYVYLVIRKVIKWWQPLLFIGLFGFTAVLLSGFAFEGGYKFDMGLFLPHIFSGGAMFAAVFMFTDYVTSPKCTYGQILYYGLAAILMAVLRYLTKVEVASFVIMLMNLIVPLIDRYVRPKPFGYKREKKAKEGK